MNLDPNRGRRSIRRGFVLTFNSTAYTAYVTLDGSTAAVSLPVGKWVAAASMAAGARVAAILFDECNPGDGVILGPF